MKSKTPSPPAFIPVIKFDQATGLCGGMLVVNLRNEPSSASLTKFGILPSAMNFVSRSGSRPSIPRMIIFRDPDDRSDDRSNDPPRTRSQEGSGVRTAHRASRHTSQGCFPQDAVIARKLLPEYCAR